MPEQAYNPRTASEQTLRIVRELLEKRPDLATLALDELLAYHKNLIFSNNELTSIINRNRFARSFQYEVGQVQFHLVREIERIVTEIRRLELLSLNKRKTPQAQQVRVKKKKLHQLTTPTPAWTGKQSDVVVSRFRDTPPPRPAPQKPIEQAENVTHVPWVILGSKIRSLPELQSYLRVYQQRGQRRPAAYDMERIAIAIQHQPSAVYLGKDEFDGYLVLYYAQHQLAVFECPIVGNALYLVRGDWQTLARRSKAELLHDESGNIKRIIHHGAWSERLAQMFSAPSDKTPAAPRTSGGGVKLE